MSDNIRAALAALRAERQRIDEAITALESVSRPASTNGRAVHGTIGPAVLELVRAEPGIRGDEIAERLAHLSGSSSEHGRRCSVGNIRVQLVHRGLIEKRGKGFFAVSSESPSHAPTAED